MSVEVPYFRPDIRESEIEAVVDVMRSGWLTTGPRVRAFEEKFAASVGAPHALALNSATAALHLALEALATGPGEAVLVPTMTFAATAEVVRYMGAYPILVDVEPATLNIDLEDAERKLTALATGSLPRIPADARPVGIIPVHVGGLMAPAEDVLAFARRHKLWVVEDAAHAYPAAWRSREGLPWIRCGEGTADVTCFSFYANKTITTGEGGMAVTGRRDLADRMRLMSLHGLSRDAWTRYSQSGSWDYRIVAPGFKYNMTDLAAAIGIEQLARAEEMREARAEVAADYRRKMAGLDEVELPQDPADRIHSWHLFPIRLRLDRLRIDRAEFIDRLKASGIGCSVHWRPLHLHPYYETTFNWKPEDSPVASREWERLVSLPIFSSMTADERQAVCDTVASICSHTRR